jgi:sugar-specific transcriptional regulator TrmB
LLKHSGLNSGKIYEILDSLKSKGLVSETEIDGIKHFTAAPPAQIRYFLEKKKIEIEKEEKIVDDILPQLELLRKQLLPEKRIVTYSGFRGIITAAEEALENTPKNEEIISLGISDINAWSQKYWVKWEKLREEKKISARYILSEKGRIYKDLKKAKHINIRLLKSDTPVGIDIYGKDKVLILHYQEPVSCTLIYDENTARTFKSYFEPLWKIAKGLK